MTMPSGKGMTRRAPGDPGASREAIQFHYDLSNEFYASWLGPSMTYSAALFDPTNGDLEAAQARKLDHHLDSAGVARAGRLLDVGCGWGSLLRRAQGRGAGPSVGLTLSRAQVTYVEERPIPDAEVRLESWRDHVKAAPYDAIVCIGAFEHFVTLEAAPDEKERTYRDFFKFCRASLVPGGKLSLQTITWGNLRAEQAAPFITGAIFPESNLPYPWEIFRAADRVLEIVSLRNDRRDYARTCRLWNERLGGNRQAAVAAAGEEKVGQYERFLRMSAAGFETGGLHLYRLVLQAP